MGKPGEAPPHILDGIELGPKMQACFPRERVFAFAIATGIAENATEAARKAGYTGKPKVLHVTAHRLMHSERIIEAVEEVCRSRFRHLIPHAISAVQALVMNPKHADHAKTVMGLLSRLGYGERTGVDVNVSGEITVDHTSRAVEDLRIMKSFGLSREKLIESFGETGLANYEKILAEKTPKLIEHAPTPAGAVEPAANLMDNPPETERC